MLVYTSIHAQASSQQAFVGTLIVSLVPSSDILGLKSGGKGAKVRDYDGRDYGYDPHCNDDLYYDDDSSRAPRAPRCAVMIHNDDELYCDDDSSGAPIRSSSR